MASNNISKSKLKKDILDILHDADDFAAISAKQVKDNLEEKYDYNLDDQKKTIEDLVAECIKQVNNKDHSKQSSASEAENGEKCVDDETDEPKTKKKMIQVETKNDSADDHNKNESTNAKAKGKGKKGETKKKVGKSDMKLSEALAKVVGADRMPRNMVVKKMWSYVKENNLQDPKNRQFTLCDEPLLEIFGKKRVKMFGMMKFLTKHMTNE